MAFLHNFNEQSRQIIKAIVLMAKELGIHTLAEGAETKAHVDFLKDVGCEKIQGYYFGRPMTYEDLSVFCKHYEHGLETRREEPVYDKAGLVNVVTDLPTAIFHYDGTQAGVLWANLAFEKSSDGLCPDTMAMTCPCGFRTFHSGSACNLVWMNSLFPGKIKS